MIILMVNKMKLYINKKTQRVWIKTCTQLIELIISSRIDIIYGRFDQKISFDFDLGRIETSNFTLVDHDLE